MPNQICLTVCFAVFVSVGCGQQVTPQVDRASRFAQSGHESSTQLLLHDFRQVLLMEVRNGKGYSDEEKEFLQGQLIKLEQEIQRIPKRGYRFEDAEDEFGMITSESKRLKLPPIEVRKIFRERWEKHFSEADPKAIDSVQRQWVLVRSHLALIEGNVKNHADLKSAFAWYVLGGKGPRGFSGFLVQPQKKLPFSVEQALADHQAKLNRWAIARIIQSLSEKQRLKLSRRLGVSVEKIPQLYDRLSPKQMNQVLSGDASRFRLAFLPIRQTAKEIQELEMEFSASKKNSVPNQNARLLQWQIRMHVAESENSFEPGIQIKKMYRSQSSRIHYAIPNELGVLPIGIFRQLQTDPAYRKYLFDEKTILSSLWIRKWFDQADMELSDKQYLQIVMLAEDVTEKTLTAKTGDELVSANNLWYQQLEKILLPKQSVLLFHKNLASMGLVCFLMRPDVGRDFGINDEQRDRIVTEASQVVDEWKIRSRQMREALLRRVLSQLDDGYRKRILQLAGVDQADFVTVVSRLSNADEMILGFDSNYRSAKRYHDVASIPNFYGGNVEASIRRYREQFKLYDILEVPYTNEMQQFKKGNTRR